MSPGKGLLKIFMGDYKFAVVAYDINRVFEAERFKGRPADFGAGPGNSSNPGFGKAVGKNRGAAEYIYRL